jgi:hypothetical protein
MHITEMMNPSDSIPSYLVAPSFGHSIAHFFSGRQHVQDKVPLKLEIASALDVIPAGLMGVSDISCITEKLLLILLAQLRQTFEVPTYL